MSLSRGPEVRATATESFSRSTTGGPRWVLVAPSCTSVVRQKVPKKARLIKGRLFSLAFSNLQC